MSAPPPPGNPPASRPAMKLKLNTGARPAEPAPQPPVQTPGSTKLKIKLGSAANTPSSEHPPPFPPPAEPSQQPAKQKRKYNKKPKDSNAPDSGAGASKAPKKRKANGDDETASSAKKAKPTTLKLKQEKSGGSQPASLRRQPSLSIKLKNPIVAPKPNTIPRLKVKHVGQPPPRPKGVGYDSEAEDIEVDPAIEHQMILRMQPGPDCDYLHNAIAERKVGLSLKEGGADVQFRFFDREGRRACITIQGHHYAASLVDLPCVIEGMKSWEKKGGWFKSGDICQMLLVLGRVDNEEAAKDFALPREIEKDTWQYPHGLTPPMHYVRKRRFRKRVSYRTIEAVEEEVERLIDLDEKARDSGGITEYEIVDLNKQQDDSSMIGDEDAPYEQELVDSQAMGEGGFFEDDDAAMAALMEQELGADDADEHHAGVVTSVEAPTANDIDAAHAVAAHALGLESTPAAETPGASAAETEESESEEDGEDEEIDEAALAAQQEAAQQREEIADLQREVENARLQMEKQSNPLLKNRLMAKYRSLQSDLELKKASLGDDWDDDLFAKRQEIIVLENNFNEAREKWEKQNNPLLKMRLQTQLNNLRKELEEKKAALENNKGVKA